MPKKIDQTYYCPTDDLWPTPHVSDADYKLLTDVELANYIEASPHRWCGLSAVAKEAIIRLLRKSTTTTI